MKFLAKLQEPAYALLRVVSGAMFTVHGLGKIFGFLGANTPPVGSQVWVGGVLELVGGLAITLGLCTPIAAFIASGMMAVAYTQFHWKLQFGRNFFPSENHGELAVLYCVLFFFLACRGSGAFSLDAARQKR